MLYLNKENLKQQLSYIDDKLNTLMVNSEEFSEELSGGIIENTLTTLTNIDHKLIELMDDICQNTYSITNKQNELNQGTNISISGDIISSIGDVTTNNLNNLLELKQNNLY